MSAESSESPGLRPPVAVSSTGQGPPVLLVHGGASPSTTWQGLDALTVRWTLRVMYRRGYPPSPPELGDGHDFDVDGQDVAGLLGDRPHLVAHSYGALGALIATARDPGRVRSLTLIEPAVYNLVPDDPAVARFQRIGDEVLTLGLEADPARLREFLRIAGASDVSDGPLPESVARGVRRAHGSRLPGAANIDLDAISRVKIPTLVVSGGHHEAIERICTAVSSRLHGERLMLLGAGHFPMRVAGFTDRLDQFLAAAGESAP